MKNNWIKVIAVASLIVAFGVSIHSNAICLSPVPKKVTAKPAEKKETTKALPRLLDLGATKCIPCKMMVPVLDELAKEYKGQLKVDFIDVWKDQASAKKYKVQSIPTQIFFDAKGKELYRHAGFYAKNDIVAKFKELGIKLKK